MRWTWLATTADVAAIVAASVIFEPSPALAVPALAAALPLLFRGPHAARRAHVISTVLLSLFAVAGAMTAGMLFVPAAVLMGIAASRTEGSSIERGCGPLKGRVQREPERAKDKHPV